MPRHDSEFVRSDFYRPDGPQLPYEVLMAQAKREFKELLARERAESTRKGGRPRMSRISIRPDRDD